MQIAAHYRDGNLAQQLEHALHTVVELMIAQRDGIVIHRTHHIHHILTFGDGAYSLTLHIVTIRHEKHIGCISNSIAQTSQLGITIDRTVDIVFVKHHDATLFALLSVNIADKSKHHAH